MVESLQPEALERELGQHLRALRLRQNLDQRELAARAGVAVGVVKRLETGQGATLKSLIKVLRILGRADWIHALAPEVSISPLQMLKTKKPRQRASKKKGSKGEDDVSPR
ncbi:MAG: helix-turn-helix transcriptional regulator [Planctomycetota bacterium]|nr:helix-turn-helix transcriptional regulator [Planctomycetota bacterium]